MAQLIQELNDARSSLGAIYERLDEEECNIIDDVKNMVTGAQNRSEDMLMRLSDIQRLTTNPDIPSDGSSDDDIIQSIDLDEILASINDESTIEAGV